MSAIGEETLYFYGAAGDYGFLSQWWMQNFRDDKKREYVCAEQWMMAEKARLMGDDETHGKILRAKQPKYMKRLGRQVTPFDEKLWESRRLAIVQEGNRLKFEQNDDLRKQLLATGERPLAEASPVDRIWGIGLSVADAQQGAKWRGLNLLGQALVNVRTALRQPGGSPPRVPFIRDRSRLAIDCGGVLSGTDTDTGGVTDIATALLQSTPSEECVAAVQQLVAFFGPDNTFVLSKCKSRVRVATASFLSKAVDGQNFFDRTGLLPRNVIFCARRSGGAVGRLRFVPIDDASLVRGAAYVPGSRQTYPDDVGKGAVAAALGLTHLIDDRLDCLRSFRDEGGIRNSHCGLFHFGNRASHTDSPPPTSSSSIPIWPCPGWSDVLRHFDPPGDVIIIDDDDDDEGSAPPQTKSSVPKRRKRQRQRVQSGILSYHADDD